MQNVQAVGRGEQSSLFATCPEIQPTSKFHSSAPHRTALHPQSCNALHYTVGSAKQTNQMHFARIHCTAVYYVNKDQHQCIYTHQKAANTGGANIVCIFECARPVLIWYCLDLAFIHSGCLSITTFSLPALWWHNVIAIIPDVVLFRSFIAALVNDCLKFGSLFWWWGLNFESI